MADVTKESLIARVELLIESGIEGIEGALHDALEAVENLFGGEDATEEGPTDGPTNVVSGTDEEQPAADAPTA